MLQLLLALGCAAFIRRPQPKGAMPCQRRRSDIGRLSPIGARIQLVIVPGRVSQDQVAGRKQVLHVCHWLLDRVSRLEESRSVVTVLEKYIRLQRSHAARRFCSPPRLPDCVASPRSRVALLPRLGAPPIDCGTLSIDRAAKVRHYPRRTRGKREVM